MRNSIISLFTLFLSLIFIRCNDPAILGSDLLKEDEIDLNYVDTFRLKARTLLDTGVITYDRSISISFNQLPMGRFDDPIFGTVEARIYAQFIKSFFELPPDFKNAVLDSAMVYLALDTVTAPYGKAAEQKHDLEVYPMLESISTTKRYRSGYYSFMNEAMAAAKLYNYFPDPKFRPMVLEPEDTFSYDPNVAFRLDNAYGNYILGLDSLWYNSDSIFLANVHGLMFRQANANQRMVHYWINSSYSRLQIFYKVGTQARIYRFPFQGGPRIPYWQHDYSPIIQEALNTPETGDQMIFLQSLSGLKAKIEFPTLKLPPGVIINKAELEVTALTLPGDDPAVFTPPGQLGLLRFDDAGNEVFISDQGALDDFTLLGGTLTTKTVNGASLSTYTMNVSNHIQEIILGKQAPECYLAIFPRSEKLSRVVLGGPQHPQYPMKLRISYTTQ